MQTLGFRSRRLRSRFDRLGPWYTAYEIDGQRLGGENSYEDDSRTGYFFEWFDTPRTILELGSFEGGHSLALAAPERVERLVGLEARPENIRRARLAVELLGRGNIDLHEVDLETVRLADFGRFDVVFCAGLLYHLSRPWRLIAEIATVTDRLFLDTHYAPVKERVVDGYEGADYVEGGREDPLSGLGSRSFWLTLPALIGALNDCGFAIRHLLDIEDWCGAGRRVHLAAIKLA